MSDPIPAPPLPEAPTTLPTTVCASRRPSPPRLVTARDVARLTVLEESRADHERPRTRAECVDGLRPCPFVGCRHHLFLDVDEQGGIRLNFPDLAPEELAESCSLDVADSDGLSLDEVAELLNVTGARLQQIEQAALGRARERLAAMGIGKADDLVADERDGFQSGE